MKEGLDSVERLQRVLDSCRSFFETAVSVRAYQFNDERFIKKVRGHYLGAFVDLIQFDHPEWTSEQVVAFIHGTEFDGAKKRSAGEDSEWLCLDAQLRDAVQMAVDYRQLPTTEFTEKYPDASGKPEPWIEEMREALDLIAGPLF